MYVAGCCFSVRQPWSQAVEVEPEVSSHAIEGTGDLASHAVEDAHEPIPSHAL